MVNMINTRDRLIEVAAQIFVEKGYAKATTREICLAAETNITSIHYYFGSKEELYRAIFSEPFKDFPKPMLDVEDLCGKSLEDAMVEFYKILLIPFMNKHLSNGDEYLQRKKNYGNHEPGFKHNKKLHHLVHDLMHKEQFEPTGLVNDLIVGPAKFIHEPLNKILCHFLNIDKPNDEVHRMAFTIVSLGFSLVHPRHIVQHYAPSLLDENNIELMYIKLAKYAACIVNSEANISK